MHFHVLSREEAGQPLHGDAIELPATGVGDALRKVEIAVERVFLTVFFAPYDFFIKIGEIVLMFFDFLPEEVRIVLAKASGNISFMPYFPTRSEFSHTISVDDR
ncbi:MAG: hypothetical protein KJO08_06325, partial [Gammaproteobacteria bacterium]|nr:hypothetical protein [Gammaproteobacteria bacterium]NNJ85004.1 hypothetical protein [Gammaproteobacteria bacterium]